jgi:hypothetical protein
MSLYHNMIEFKAGEMTEKHFVFQSFKNFNVRLSSILFSVNMQLPRKLTSKI